MTDRRPVVFIGSSSEGLEIAEAIQVNLDRVCEVVIWSQGVFGLAKGTLESLAQRVNDFDFAVLVLTPDDLITSREKTQQSARDNVLIELGLFIGRIGRDRTFVIFDRGADMKLPSDLAGVTIADYQLHSSGNLRSSVGAPCTMIKESIREAGARERIDSDTDRNTRQTTGRKMTEEIRIQPVADAIITDEHIDPVLDAITVVDNIEREAAKLVKSDLVQLVIEKNVNGGILKMIVPLLNYELTLLEFAYSREPKGTFGLGYPVNLTEYLTTEDKTVHEIEDDEDLVDALRNAFNSATAKTKIEKVLQVAISKSAERRTGGN